MTLNQLIVRMREFIKFEEPIDTNINSSLPLTRKSKTENIAKPKHKSRATLGGMKSQISDDEEAVKNQLVSTTKNSSNNEVSNLQLRRLKRAVTSPNVSPRNVNRATDEADATSGDVSNNQQQDNKKSIARAQRKGTKNQVFDEPADNSDEFIILNPSRFNANGISANHLLSAGTNFINSGNPFFADETASTNSSSASKISQREYAIQSGQMENLSRLVTPQRALTGGIVSLGEVTQHSTPAAASLVALASFNTLMLQNNNNNSHHTQRNHHSSLIKGHPAAAGDNSFSGSMSQSASSFAVGQSYTLHLHQQQHHHHHHQLNINHHTAASNVQALQTSVQATPNQNGLFGKQALKGMRTPSSRQHASIPSIYGAVGVAAAANAASSSSSSPNSPSGPLTRMSTGVKNNPTTTTPTATTIIQSPGAFHQQSTVSSVNNNHRRLSTIINPSYRLIISAHSLVNNNNRTNNNSNISTVVNGSFQPTTQQLQQQSQAVVAPSQNPPSPSTVSLQGLSKRVIPPTTSTILDQTEPFSPPISSAAILNLNGNSHYISMPQHQTIPDSPKNAPPSSLISGAVQQQQQQVLPDAVAHRILESDPLWFIKLRPFFVELIDTSWRKVQTVAVPSSSHLNEAGATMSIFHDNGQSLSSTNNNNRAKQNSDSYGEDFHSEEHFVNHRFSASHLLGHWVSSEMLPSVSFTYPPSSPSSSHASSSDSEDAIINSDKQSYSSSSYVSSVVQHPKKIAAVPQSSSLRPSLMNATSPSIAKLQIRHQNDFNSFHLDKEKSHQNHPNQSVENSQGSQRVGSDTAQINQKSISSSTSKPLVASGVSIPVASNNDDQCTVIRAYDNHNKLGHLSERSDSGHEDMAPPTISIINHASHNNLTFNSNGNASQSVVNELTAANETTLNHPAPTPVVVANPQLTSVPELNANSNDHLRLYSANNKILASLQSISSPSSIVPQLVNDKGSTNHSQPINHHHLDNININPSTSLLQIHADTTAERLRDVLLQDPPPEQPLDSFGSSIPDRVSSMHQQQQPVATLLTADPSHGHYHYQKSFTSRELKESTQEVDCFEKSKSSSKSIVSSLSESSFESTFMATHLPSNKLDSGVLNSQKDGLMNQSSMLKKPSFNDFKGVNSNSQNLVKWKSFEKESSPSLAENESKQLSLNGDADASKLHDVQFSSSNVSNSSFKFLSCHNRSFSASSLQQRQANSNYPGRHLNQFNPLQLRKSTVFRYSASAHPLKPFQALDSKVNRVDVQAVGGNNDTAFDEGFSGESSSTRSSLGSSSQRLDGVEFMLT